MPHLSRRTIEDRRLSRREQLPDGPEGMSTESVSWRLGRVSSPWSWDGRAAGTVCIDTVYLSVTGPRELLIHWQGPTNSGANDVAVVAVIVSCLLFLPGFELSLLAYKHKKGRKVKGTYQPTSSG